MTAEFEGNITPDDPKLKKSVQDAMVKESGAGTTPDDVKVTIKEVSGGRRLGLKVEILYEILIKNAQNIDVNEALATWSALTPAKMSQTISDFLTENGVEGVKVTVTDMPDPTLEWTVDANDSGAPSLFQFGNVVSVLVLSLWL